MDIYKKYINPSAADKKLVNVGRITSVVALLIALFTVKPLLGGIPQAFQYIQEYSGFIYPGIITVFGLGLLWKRASSTAAVWTAIITIPLGVLFKVCFGDVPFQFRAGYIFIIVVSFFIIVSLLDKKFVSAPELSDADKKQMLKWANIMGGAGIIMIIAAIIVILMGDSTSWTAYLNDIGFQAFIFFGVLVGCNGIWLWSDAKHKVQDPKALPINLSLFTTTRGYTWGTIGIAVITMILYVVLW